MLEMFVRYKWLYKALFAVFPWVYVVPLFNIVGKYRRLAPYAHTAELFAALAVGICTVLHPHPTLYSHSVAALLLVQHTALIRQTKPAFFTVIGYVIGLVLSVYMWDMWGHRLGGNANFFYFQTILVNLMALGFLFALLRELVFQIQSVRVT